MQRDRDEIMSEKEMDFMNIVDELQVIAEEDGTVTKEEASFLKKLEENVRKFKQAILEAEQDEVISDDEFHDLVLLRDSILADAINFNPESDDLEKMVNTLYEEINKYKIPGMVEDEFPAEDD